MARIWRKWDLQPHRIEGFKFSTDPELEFKIRDVVGLYLDPPANAVVVSVDEKSQIQALDRTAPMLPLRPGLPARQSYDYRRNGTTTLFAALEVATGKITADACYPRHRHQEFLRFLRKVAAAHPAIDLHIVADNYAAHKHPAVKAWLKDNPRITLHFTPTSCSWLNMVEIFFGIITRQAIRRGTFRSVKDLTTAIGTFIDAYNDRCTPFAWTKDADELLAKIRPAKSDRERVSTAVCGVVDQRPFSSSAIAAMSSGVSAAAVSCMASATTRTVAVASWTAESPLCRLVHRRACTCPAWSAKITSRGSGCSG